MSKPANKLQYLTSLAPACHQALLALWEAHCAALELSRDAGTFACQLPSLQAQGLSDTALRWLVDQALAEHRLETTRPGKKNRTFQPAPNLRFTPASCFLLTHQGSSLARQLFPDPLHSLPQPHHSFIPTTTHQPPSTISPTWDPDQRILFVGPRIVKHFKVPADSQTLILACFQEQNWSPHLDDPLPPKPGIDPKKRLHDVIRRLNDNQQNELLHFHGDGRGRGIGWRFHDMKLF